MELKLESNLEHQLKPVMAVADVVEASIAPDKPRLSHQNPTMSHYLDQQALHDVQKRNDLLNHHGLPAKQLNPRNLPDKVRELPHHNVIDVKMETGTGKTYVYTRTMYELHKRTGINKFIIAVPTLPIKAGTAAFLDDTEVMRHFSDVCGYDAQIELCLLEAPKKQSKKKGRQNMPTAIRKFFLGNMQQKNRIYVLLLNTQLITSGKILTRDDYDQMLGDFYRPVDAIADTHPVLIIDEPHRMERPGKSYMSLIQNFRPQLVLRYGATFPELTLGSGKKKVVNKDYDHLVYNLDAAESFNRGLIKGVAKEHIELPGGKSADRKVKVLSMKKGDSVNLQYQQAGKPATTHTLRKGESLSVIDSDFDGITIEAITTSVVELSNGQEKHVGEEFFPDQYSASYQEAMLDLALMRHFETERRNFSREGLPIKTLALFFIDNIQSFRGEEGKNDGWLREKFLELLKARVEKELGKKEQNTPEYTEYLQATLNHLDDTCAGYFAQDNNASADTDDAIAQEAKVILHGKKQLLSFRHEDGSPNVLRFLFSKWTLKEGWDNPNVFTICKLRTSGSEISKLQEVGRGLRLPVDSAGNRISTESFMLNYIVDFTERDFANKLVAEINSDISVQQAKPLAITQEDIFKVAKKRGISEEDFFIELMQKKYVGFDRTIKADRYDELLIEYPELMETMGGVSRSRIINRNSKRRDTIHIRKAQFDELRELWGIINRKYVLYFDHRIEEMLTAALPGIIKHEHVFALQVLGTDRQELTIADEDTAFVREGMAYAKQGAQSQITARGKHYGYSDFLKKASKKTNIPLHALHQAIVAVAKDGTQITDEMMNEDTLTRLIMAVDSWKSRTLAGQVRYKQAHYRVKETKLTHADGSAKDEVVQAYIGTKLEPGMPPSKYLYDAYAYDSELELKNIREDIEEVIVYGKIPSHSICIPTVASSNYSPDFMYVVKKADGSKELNIVIETKAYDNETQMAQDEERKIDCAEEFFKALQADGYEVRFRRQLNTSGVKAIINELIMEPS